MTQLETPVRKRAKCTALPTPFSTPSSSRRASEYFPEIAPEIVEQAPFEIVEAPEIVEETAVESEPKALVIEENELEKYLVGVDDISTLRCNKTGRKWWRVDLESVYRCLLSDSPQFRETVIPGRIFHMFFMWNITMELYTQILEKNALTEIEFDRKLGGMVEEMYPPPGRIGILFAKNIKNPSNIQIRLPYYMARTSDDVSTMIDSVERAFLETFDFANPLITEVYNNDVGLCMIGSEENDGSGLFQAVDLESGAFVEIDPEKYDRWWSVVMYALMENSSVVPAAPDMCKEPIPTLEEFLQPFAIDDTEFVTHTSMNGLPFPGKWSIPIEENGWFLRVLHHHVFVKKLPAYISERIEKGKAYEFFADFDFAINTLTSSGLLDGGEHVFNQYLYDIVKASVLETEIGRHRLRDLILSSKPGHPNKVHINSDVTCQDRNLAPSILISVANVFKERFPTIDWKKTFDLNPYDCGLRMLGCSKPGDIPYQVYNLRTGNHEQTNLNIMCRTSIRSHLVALGGRSDGGGSCSVDPETDMAVRVFVDHLRSTKAFGNQPLEVNKVKWSGGKFINVTLNDTRCPYIGRAHNGNPKRLYLFITGLGVWLKCWDVDSCAHGRDRALLTDEMKALMSKYEEEEEPPENVEPDIGDVCGESLCEEESEDDTVVDFEYFSDADMNAAFRRSFKGTDHDVAGFAVHLVKDEFASVDSKNTDTSWWQFRNGRWFNNDASTNLFARLDTLPSIYEEAASKSSSPKLQKIIQNVQRNVSDLTFLKKIIVRMNNMLRDGNLETMLDSKYHLLGFNDGVYDFHEMRFRQAVKADYVSMTVGYDFPKESDPVYRAKLMKFLEEIQPDPIQRMYSLKVDASCLNAEVPYELFFTLSGNLRNGKTVKNDLMMATLGAKEYLREECKCAYASQFSTDFLCKDRKDSDPAPELLEFRHARLLVCTEPDPGVKIRTGTLKRAIGRETWAARLLHSNKRIHFKILALIAILVNDLPELSSHEPAVWEKFRRINYPTKFVDNPTLPHEKKIDRPLKLEVKTDLGWRKEFMLLLLEIYRDELLSNGLEPAPECVLTSTLEYQEEANPLMQWWEENTEESLTHISTQSLRDDFRFYENGDPKISTKAFNKRLRQELGLVIKKSIRCAGKENPTIGIEHRKLKHSMENRGDI